MFTVICYFRKSMKNIYEGYYFICYLYWAGTFLLVVNHQKTFLSMTFREVFFYMDCLLFKENDDTRQIGISCLHIKQTSSEARPLLRHLT